MTQEQLAEKEKRDLKIIQMLKSNDKELTELGMQLLKNDYPAVWSGIVNLSGLGEITDDLLKIISEHQEVQIGTNVRYRGLPGGPVMVVTNASVIRLNSQKLTGYGVEITVKYFNKSKQEFTTTKDRVEAFELVVNVPKEKQKED